MAIMRPYKRKTTSDNVKKEYLLVMKGIEQIKNHRTKDFHSVCDRLEKKYESTNISD